MRSERKTFGPFFEQENHFPIQGRQEDAGRKDAAFVDI